MDSLLQLFCDVDDFCKVFLPFWNRHLLAGGQKRRQRKRSLTISEMMTILTAFHQSHYRDFKAYYLEQILTNWRSEFPVTVPILVKALDLAIYAGWKGFQTPDI